MSFNEFYEKCRAHDYDKRQPVKHPLMLDGYTLKYDNGDFYEFIETLIPGRRPDWNGNYSTDDFTYECRWNGETIEPAA